MGGSCRGRLAIAVPARDTGGLWAVSDRSADASRDTRGQSIVEYALILALIAIVVVTALSELGFSTGNAINDVSDAIQGPSSLGGCG